jgi:hypothetical protein
MAPTCHSCMALMLDLRLPLTAGRRHTSISVRGCPLRSPFCRPITAEENSEHKGTSRSTMTRSISRVKGMIKQHPPHPFQTTAAILSPSAIKSLTSKSSVSRVYRFNHGHGTSTARPYQCTASPQASLSKRTRRLGQIQTGDRRALRQEGVERCHEVHGGYS